MNEIFQLCLYTLFYYQIDSILKPCLYDNFDLFNQEIIIFYPVIQSANIFILSIFSIFTIYLIFFSKIKNYTIYSLSLIYIKYTLDTVIHNNTISIYQYEFNRTLMWFFTTPLILKLYCDMNNLTFNDINAYFHIISNALHIILFPFRKTQYNLYIILVLSFSEVYFIYKLFELREKYYTKFIIYIWCLFSFITFIEIFNIFSIHDIQLCYLLSDMIAKLTTVIIVNDYQEHIFYIKSNIDLQSISLLTTLKKNLKKFENINNVTTKCKSLIKYFNNNLISLVPIDTTLLKLELLKKILPFELEDKYLSQSNDCKEYDYICILFTDIVSYTELAKEYDSSVIYKLLNDVYTRFDDIIIKYSNLQKIETIGDAYMVVGDIYNNDTKNNVKNIILLAVEFLHEAKLIETPNNKPLQLRIGINIGKVVIGILGVEIPRLCVIGNTVNVAARLQTTTDPDTIQISRHIYEIAKDTDFGMNIEFDIRENVFLKNLGTTTTYIINNI